jgi:hypothetical protein
LGIILKIMKEKSESKFTQLARKNEDTPPSGLASAFIDARNRFHALDLDERYASESNSPSKEERDLKSDLYSKVVDKLGVQKDLDRLQQLRAKRLESLRKTPTDSNLHEPGATRYFNETTNQNDTWVWWAKTMSWCEATVATIWMDEAGTHIAASADSNTGNLYKTSIKVISQYVIAPDRLPPSNRKYLSHPVFTLTGPVWGSAMLYTLLFEFGDTWAKCWLHMKQTVFMLSGGFDGIQNTLASNHDSETLIFIEDIDLKRVNLPGLRGLPVEFYLPERAEALIFELEWQFDIQVENGGINLGHTPEAQSCTILHPQWAIRAL